MLTPKYAQSLVIEHLAATLNASAYWRALCASPESEEHEIEAIADEDSADASYTLAQIRRHLYEPDAVEARPFFLVRHLTDTDIARFGTTGWETTGQLLITCEFETPPAYRHDVELAGTFFCNALGRILYEARDAIEQDPAGKLNVTNFDVRSLGKIDPDEINGIDAWGAFIVAHYLD